MVKKKKILIQSKIKVNVSSRGGHKKFNTYPGMPLAEDVIWYFKKPGNTGNGGGN